jgi:hypothetical protein
MKAKKVLSPSKIEKAIAPATKQPIIKGNNPAVQTVGKAFTFTAKPMTAREIEIYRLNCEITKEETTKSMKAFFSDFYHAKPEFTDLEWYEARQVEVHELRMKREQERKIAMGLLSTVVPDAWNENVASKDLFTASFFGWLVSLAREFQVDDAYQVDLSECLDDLPSYDRHGKVAGMSDKAKHFHAVISKAKSALLPLVDRYSGEVKRPGCPDCRIEIERIKGIDSYMVSFR